MLLSLFIHKQSCNFDHLMDQIYQQRVGRCLDTLGEQFQLLFEHFFDFIFRHDVIPLSAPARRGFLVVPFIGLSVCYSVGTGMSRMRQMLATIPGVEISPRMMR